MSHDSLLQRENTPFFLIDIPIALRQFARFSRTFPSAGVYYPVKTNPQPELIMALYRAGSNLQVSTLHELRLLKRLRIPTSRMLAYNPSWGAADFRFLAGQGVHSVVVDSLEQLSDYLRSAPQNGMVFLRIASPSRVRNEKYPSRHLGIAPATLATFLANADLGSVQLGIHLHAGSQLSDVTAYALNVGMAVDLCLSLQNAGIAISAINLGGGFPVPYDEDVPSLQAMRRAIAPHLRRAEQRDLLLFFEPGRYLAAPAGMLVTSVLQVKRNVLFVDDSVYRSYLDTLIAGIRLPAFTLKKGKPRRYSIRGNSTCSLDVFGTAFLPGMHEGERVVFRNAGAYSIGSDFMGMPATRRVVVRS